MSYVIVGSYRRYGIYDIEEVLNFIGPNVKEYKQLKVKMDSLRYHTFNKSIVCVTCGIVGVHFALETHNNNHSSSSPHFNLYAINVGGHEVMMTKDHIIPKSKGGSDHIDNLQPMCTKCNGKKDDKIVRFSLCQ